MSGALHAKGAQRNGNRHDAQADESDGHGVGCKPGCEVGLGSRLLGRRGPGRNGMRCVAVARRRRDGFRLFSLLRPGRGAVRIKRGGGGRWVFGRFARTSLSGCRGHAGRRGFC